MLRSLPSTNLSHGDVAALVGNHDSVCHRVKPEVPEIKYLCYNIVSIVPQLVNVIPKSSGYLLRGSMVSCLSTCLGGLEVRAVFDFPFSLSHRNNSVDSPSAVTDQHLQWLVAAFTLDT